jgi:hypothetical protein
MAGESFALPWPRDVGRSWAKDCRDGTDQDWVRLRFKSRGSTSYWDEGSLPMKRWLALGLLAISLASCQMNRSPSDPFLRTTVPPPATGQFTTIAPAGEPYYAPNVGAPPVGTAPPPGSYSGPGSFTAPPPTQPPAAYPPSSPPATFGSPPANFSPPPAAAQPYVPPPAGLNNRYAPPNGGFNYQGTSLDRSKAVDPQSDSARVGSRVVSRTVASASPAIAIVPAGASSDVATAAADTKDAASDAVAATTTAAGAAESAVTSASTAVNNTVAAADDPRVLRASYAEPVTTADTARDTATGDAAPSTGAGGSSIRIVVPTSGSVAADATAEADTAVATASSAADNVQNSANSLAGAAGQAVQEITDLPESAASKSPRMYGAPRSRLVFGRRGPTVAAAAPAASPDAVPHSVERPLSSSAPAYGVDGNYEKLYGKLEYSQSSQQWKLRYIPIDGQTDQYGGSVVLKNNPALQQMNAGAFVVASGRVASEASGKGGFSPQYDLQQIAPQ